MILSKIQEEIINHKEGALLVMASAGSGKTRVLTERIKKILEEEDGGFHVLALTMRQKRCVNGLCATTKPLAKSILIQAATMKR